MLFYRRRSPAPLGPPSLQRIVTAANSQNSEGENDDTDTDAPRSRSPAGNGSRLDDLSRNGSSSAGAIGAGVGVQRGDGSAHSAAGSRLKNGVAAATNHLSDDDADAEMLLCDEGYDDNDGAVTGYGGYAYAPGADAAAWSFDHLNSRDDGSDAASDMPALGSIGGEDLSTRLLEDFGDDDDDDELGTQAGVGTPVEGMAQPLQGESDEDSVAEIRLKDD